MSGALLLVIVAVVGIPLLLLLWVVGIYNGLIGGRNQAKNAWSQIDVQLKRRHDLIPNLVETVKGYATHEKGTLENVIKARNQAIAASGVENQIKAETELSGALQRLMVVVEQYPALKANTNFLALQEELSSTENKIGFSRQFYNDSATHYNTKLEVFPANIVAGMFRFQPSVLYAIENAVEREAPKVKF